MIHLKFYYRKKNNSNVNMVLELTKDLIKLFRMNEA